MTRPREAAFDAGQRKGAALVRCPLNVKISRNPPGDHIHRDHRRIQQWIDTQGRACRRGSQSSPA